MKKIWLLILAAVLMCGGCERCSKQKDEGSEGGGTAAGCSGPKTDAIKCVGDIPTWDAHAKRDAVEPGSFAEYLRKLPLKPKGYPTHWYNGIEKANRTAAYRVVDMDIDSVDLQQCADACIRLYAEYLWHGKQYGKIKFHFVSGFLADYERWAHGERIRVNGNHASWYRVNNHEDYSYKTFREYLLMVFMYAGTASLPQDMENVGSTPSIGDVIIQPGSPGHAVMVVDKAGEMFIVAQSYMPAQEIEILRSTEGTGCWTIVDGDKVITPEWRFDLSGRAKIMRFKNSAAR